jgi:hypothetical protein
METKILANRSNYLEAISDERSSWVSFILESLELDMDIINSGDKGLVFDYLVEQNIDIVDYPELGAVKVVFGSDVVGEWGAPDFTLRTSEDASEIYYEIIIENWSIFDD